MPKRARDPEACDDVGVAATTEDAQAKEPASTFADQLSNYARKKNLTILQRVESAIMKAEEPLSQMALVKACSTEGSDGEAKVRRAIKKALETGTLLRSSLSKSKFWLVGYPEPAPEEPIKVSIQDDFPGTGEPIEAGDQVSINYELYLAADTKKLVEKGKKFVFHQGEGHVIKGMDAGVLGLKVGVVRKVTVPWQLGYGKRGSGPGIPPCADLLFIIIRQ